MPLKDILPSSGGASKAGILPYVSGKHKKLVWGAEFVSTAFIGSLMAGTQETAFLHDFTLTFLLPTPQQMERREIDF